MSEYIDREELIDSLNTVGLSPDYIRMQVYPREVVKMIICDCPKADVRENIHGEWKRISPAGIYECSCCGQNVMTSDIECYKFCHGCGARMKGGE